MLDDKEVLRGSDFGSYDVTNCGGATLSPIVCPSVTQPPTSSPPVVTQPPTPSPTAVTQSPTPSPTSITQSPTPSPSKKCEEGSDLVRINVTLGEQPSDSYWDLRDQRDDKKIIVDVRYDVKAQTVVREVCKPREDCYLFRLSTTDASALVYLNGNEIPTDIPPEREIKIGDSCC